MSKNLPRNYKFFFYFLNRELPLDKKCKVLDYGCGDGLIVQEGRKHGYEIFGVDNFYGNYVHNITLSPYIRLLGTRNEIPWPHDFFDVIISNQVIEHIADLERAVSEMSRVLKRGGGNVPLISDLRMHFRRAYWYSIRSPF